MKKILKFAILLLILIGISSFVFTDIEHRILLFFQEQFDNLTIYYQKHPIWFTFGFFMTFALINAFMIPIALVLMLLSGALFGLQYGLLLCVISGTIGSTITFLFIRLTLNKTMKKRFKRSWSKFDKAIQQNSLIYLLALRLSPGIPTYLINVGMAFTRISFLQFFFGTFFGVIPWFAIYTHAGVKLLEIETLGDIVSLQTTAWFIAVVLLLLATTMIKRLLPLKNAYLNKA